MVNQRGSQLANKLVDKKEANGVTNITNIIYNFNLSPQQAGPPGASTGPQSLVPQRTTQSNAMKADHEDDPGNQASSRSHSDKLLRTANGMQNNEPRDAQRMHSFSHKQDLYPENEQEESLGSGTKKRPKTGSNPFRPSITNNEQRMNPESAALLRGANDHRTQDELNKQTNFHSKNTGNSAIQIGQVVKMHRNNTID